MKNFENSNEEEINWLHEVTLTTMSMRKLREEKNKYMTENDIDEAWLLNPDSITNDRYKRRYKDFYIPHLKTIDDKMNEYKDSITLVRKLKNDVRSKEDELERITSSYDLEKKEIEILRKKDKDNRREIDRLTKLTNLTSDVSALDDKDKDRMILHYKKQLEDKRVKNNLANVRNEETFNKLKDEINKLLKNDIEKDKIITELRNKINVQDNQSGEYKKIILKKNGKPLKITLDEIKEFNLKDDDKTLHFYRNKNIRWIKDVPSIYRKFDVDKRILLEYINLPPKLKNISEGYLTEVFIRLREPKVWEDYIIEN